MFFMLILFFSQGKILSEKKISTSWKPVASRHKCTLKKKQTEKKQAKQGKGKVKLKEIKLECDKIANVWVWAYKKAWLRNGN